MRNDKQQSGSRRKPTRRTGEDTRQLPVRSSGEAVRLVTAGDLVPEPHYRYLPLTYFVGRCVKVPFESEDNPIEYMWVRVTGIDGDKLVGTLDNEPFLDTRLRYGDTVHVLPSEVVMVDLSIAEWRKEVDLLRAKDDFFNPWLGVASGPRFERLHGAWLSPREALTWWRDWQPWEDD